MKEHAILFSAPMIRALVDGTKSQTRRVMKPQPAPIPNEPGKHWWPSNAAQSMIRVEDEFQQHPGIYDDACPHGMPGQHLWVRETFYAYGHWVTRFSAKKKRDEWHFIDMTLACDRAYQYAADNPDVPLAKGRGGALPGWYTRPAIFMPRAACRILLGITGVRVERLNDCSDADAMSEGIDADELAERQDRYDIVCKGGDASGRTTAQLMYRELWESINGAGSWAANPWVWVVEFKRVMP